MCGIVGVDTHLNATERVRVWQKLVTTSLGWKAQGTLRYLLFIRKTSNKLQRRDHAGYSFLASSSESGSSSSGGSLGLGYGNS
jgi:hypothetical protein